MFSLSLAQHNNKRRLIRYYEKHLLTKWQPRRNKFIYKQQRLKHEVKENQNRPIMNTEIESAIKNFTKKYGVVAQSAGKVFANITEKEKTSRQ